MGWPKIPFTLFHVGRHISHFPTRTLSLFAEFRRSCLQGVRERHHELNMVLESKAMCHVHQCNIAIFCLMLIFDGWVSRVARTHIFLSAQVKDNTFLDWFSRGDSRHPVFGKVSAQWFQHVFGFFWSRWIGFFFHK